MNLKIVGSLVTLTATGAALGCYFFFSEITFNPHGKTAKTRYPTLKVPAYGQYSSDGVYDNSFWLQKTKRLKNEYYNKGETWNKLLASFRSNATLAGYSFQEFAFKERQGSSDFDGESYVAETLGKYCKVKWNSEEKDIENYPEIMRNLCAP
ncbi:hypothetical protein A6V39_01700 [Candidatus Mycoplasma haematobovis]|uniref:Lipoprotein n=1 Tax=Candidatus Mycoplasma haematobovis TaxID=432608 RepID=A0A1A9QE53_9MOLU|nr:hypothetical protein [Candidatus Mycoplasma haematobovis]OAL10757.1 hypothetical protein A6V39_01700 [Candidatus Mycoplasma haematobovis]